MVTKYKERIDSTIFALVPKLQEVLEKKGYGRHEIRYLSTIKESNDPRPVITYQFNTNTEIVKLNAMVDGNLIVSDPVDEEGFKFEAGRIANELFQKLKKQIHDRLIEIGMIHDLLELLEEGNESRYLLYP